jgi:hypothetical protein
MVHGIEHFAVHDFFQLLEVDDKSGAGIDLTFYGDFQRVVVAVAIRITGLAKDAAIFFRREIRIVIVMRGGELSFAGEIDHRKRVPSSQWPVVSKTFPSESEYVRPFHETLPWACARSERSNR